MLECSIKREEMWYKQWRPWQKEIRLKVFKDDHDITSLPLHLFPFEGVPLHSLPHCILL